MNETELKARTKKFALRVLKMSAAMPRTIEAGVLRRQVSRSGTAVPAAYRAACRARSDEDFAYKLSLAEEESDETALWLELISDADTLPARRVSPLLAEANELTAIFVSSQRTLRRRIRTNPKSKIKNPK